MSSAASTPRFVDRFLIMGDIASVAACIIMAALGAWWLLIVALLPAFAGYALINDGGWNRAR